MGYLVAYNCLRCFVVTLSDWSHFPHDQQLYQMPKVQILLTVLLPLISSQCPASLLSTSVTTANLNLISTDTSSLYTYSYPTPYDRLPQATFGITGVQLDPTKQPLAYFWATPLLTTTDLKLVTSAAKSGWAVSRVRVILTTNSELLLDLVSAATHLADSEVQSSVGSATVQFKLNSNNVFADSTPLIIRTFLAGLNSTNGVSFLLLGTSTLEKNTLTVALQVTAQSSFFLMLSVAIFPQQSTSFAVYGNTASMAGPGSKIADLFQTLTASQNIYYGLNGLSIPTKTQSATFSADIGSDFILNMTANGEASFQLSYFFLGNPANQICSKCQLFGLGSTYFQGNCVQSCPSLTVEVSVDGSKVCRGCSSAMNLVYSAGKCIQCENNTVVVEGQCVPKTTLTNIQPSKVSLQTGTINLNNVSIAPIAIQPTQQTSKPTPPNLTLSNLQCPLPNTFWNGNQCTCVVGYTLVADICVKVFIPIINQSNLCSGQNQYFDGLSCSCLPGYFYLNGNCTKCPSNSIFNGQYCACNPGYTLNASTCIPTKTIICPPNSTNNGKGQCLCNSKNYTLINNTCQLISCTISKIWNGSACVCDRGTTLSANGSCLQRCAANQQWQPVTQTCLNICGLNMRFDSQQLRCVCIDGFAFGVGNQCQQCQQNYFPFNGYCVTCPSYSSPINGNCVCQSGYLQMVDGTCSPKCGSLESYNPTTNQCECLNGLARINGNCGLCSPNTYLQGGSCYSCTANAQLMGGKCVCGPGYIADTYGTICVPCSSQNNSFLLNGYCVKCPYGQIYNQQTNQCSCPRGTILSFGSCVPACRADQAYDPNRNCFSCGANMMLLGGQCVCRKGYVTQGCGCRLNCGSNQFQYYGVCAQCPPSTIYMQAIQGCVCPSGYYWSNIINNCLQSPPTPAICNITQYLQTTTNQCVSCHPTCYNCTQTACLQCLNGYLPTSNASVCQPVCGDGLILGSETCDPGPTSQPGCQNCNVLYGYSCSGQPSVCKLTNNSPPTPINQTDSLLLKLSPQVNANNIFVSLTTSPTFTFNDPTTMKSFIRVSFMSTVIPTVYCLQQSSSNLNCFDCLFIYPNGVPNNPFNVTFSYNYQGHSSQLTIQINPLLQTGRLSNRP